MLYRGRDNSEEQEALDLPTNSGDPKQISIRDGEIINFGSTLPIDKTSFQWMANLYVDEYLYVDKNTPPAIVIGETNIHSELRIDFQEFFDPTYRNASSIAGYFIPHEKRISHDQKLRGDIVIRLESDLLPGEKLEDPEKLHKLVEKYERALALAHSAAKYMKGKVIVEAYYDPEKKSSENIYLMKMLGVGYLEKPRSVFSVREARAFLQSQTQPHDEKGDFLYANRGSRYKTWRQLHTDLHEHLDDKEEMIYRLEALAEFFDPSPTPISRNAQGTREAYFLVLDESGRADESSKTQGKLYQEFLKLKDRLSDFTEKEWFEDPTKVTGHINKFIKLFRSLSKPLYRDANPDDARYVLKLAAIIRGEKEAIIRGAKSTTPLDNVPLGKVNQRTGSFKFFRGVPQDLREITKGILRNRALETSDEKEPKSLLWIEASRPRNPLLEEGYAGVVKYGDIDDESYVFGYGDREYQVQKVVRKKTYDTQYWREAQEAGIVPKEFPPEFLSHVSSEAKRLQCLYSNILSDSNLEPFRSVTMGGAGEREIRSWIEGDRLDYERRAHFTKEKLLSYAFFLGDMAARSYYTQRGVLKPSEIIISNRDKFGHPQEVIEISSSSSFFNISKAVSPEDYDQKVISSASAYYASWYSVAEVGIWGSEASDKELRSFQKDFYELWRRGFIDRAEIMKENWDNSGDFRKNIHDQFSHYQTRYKKPLPSGIALGANLDFTGELLRESPEVVADLHIAHMKGHNRKFRNIHSDIPDKDGTGLSHMDCKEDLISELSSLLCHHGVEGSHYADLTRYIRDFSFSQYSTPETRKHFLTLLDVSTWVLRVSDEKTLKGVCELVVECSTAESFFEQARASHPRSHIKRSQAKRFHTAVHALLHGFIGSDNHDQLRCDMHFMTAGGFAFDQGKEGSSV